MSRSVFEELDFDANGQVRRAELEVRVKEPSVYAYFAALGVNMEQTFQLFDSLDLDGSGYITMDEFTQGCLRLKGKATTVDMALLHHEVRLLQDGMEHIRELIHEKGWRKGHHEQGLKLFSNSSSDT